MAMLESIAPEAGGHRAVGVEWLGVREREQGEKKKETGQRLLWSGLVW